jgi:hypothetical protein
MPEQSKDGMQCTEFEALLSEALDETLTGPKLESFRAHARGCKVCGPLFAEVEAGMKWLTSLAEAEPPANLVHNILVATSGQEPARARSFAALPKASWGTRASELARSIFGPMGAVVRQPRFAMSFAMAFFSLSLVLSVAGVRPSDIKSVDLRPSALKRTYYETEGRVVRYYENIRFVYEIESRVREIRRATTPAEPAPEEKEKERKNNTSERPEQRQERNYSQEEIQPVLASRPSGPPVVTVTTTRRFV